MNRPTQLADTLTVCLILVTALMLVSASERRNNYREEVYMPYRVQDKQAHKKGVQCYQCAYSPAKTVYKSVKYPVQVKDYYGFGYGKTRVVYRTRLVPLRKSGGWDKCMGPFDDYRAKTYGLDVWNCHSNCYTRRDKNGNVFRGCYKGEYGVDPKKLGCHLQAQQLYCFCEGDKCNNKSVPDFKED